VLVLYTNHTHYSHTCTLIHTCLYTGAGVNRIYEGDPAPTDCFQELVNIKSENAIGTKGADRLVPWLHRNSDRHDDYTIILTDPRPQSSELRESCKKLVSELPDDLQSRLVVINADGPAENRRWVKKDQLELEVLSDEKLEFMRAYTALGETRWSMTVFVIANGRVQKLARDVDRYSCSRVMRNAVSAMKSELRL
jgi:AhpC/TSA family